MFRIGHLGNSNDLTLLATLAGCEMGFRLARVPLSASGVQSAMEYFAVAPRAHSQAGRVKRSRAHARPPQRG